jgi:hypothetical protein
MEIYIQISNYTRRICGAWNYMPTEEERIIEFNKDIQGNEPNINCEPQYHTSLSKINFNAEI